MDGLRVRPGWLAILAWLVGCGTCPAADRSPESALPPGFTLLPLLDDVPEPFQHKVRLVVERPTMHARGPVETFRCQPRVYYWLMEHPDRAVKAWVRLGARCMPITDRGNGRFGCKDGQGTDVVWTQAVNTPTHRIWYAEGVVRPGLLLPLVTVRAVFVMHLTEVGDPAHPQGLRHQGELVLHMDSKAAALATRLLGASAPRMAEQSVGQIETFFAALAWYLNEHPDKADTLLAD
jgi:hypothetical protein